MIRHTKRVQTVSLHPRPESGRRIRIYYFAGEAVAAGLAAVAVAAGVGVGLGAAFEGS